MDFFDSYGIYFSRRRPSALGTRFASRTPAMHPPSYYARSACQVIFATDVLTASYFRPMFTFPLLHHPGRDLGAIKRTSNLKDLKPAKQAGKQPCIVCFHGKSPSAPTIAYSIVRGQCALGRALPFEYRRRLSASRWCTHQAPDTNIWDNQYTGWLPPVLLHNSIGIAH